MKLDVDVGYLVGQVKALQALRSSQIFTLIEEIPSTWISNHFNDANSCRRYFTDFAILPTQSFEADWCEKPDSILTQ